MNTDMIKLCSHEINFTLSYLLLLVYIPGVFDLRPVNCGNNVYDSEHCFCTLGEFEFCHPLITRIINSFIRVNSKLKVLRLETICWIITELYMFEIDVGNIGIVIVFLYIEEIFIHWKHILYEKIFGINYILMLLKCLYLIFQSSHVEKNKFI